MSPPSVHFDGTDGELFDVPVPGLTGNLEHDEAIRVDGMDSIKDGSTVRYILSSCVTTSA